jgi:methylated-DNA-[protein]-cysteine S-methyltransferase
MTLKENPVKKDGSWQITRWIGKHRLRLSGTREGLTGISFHGGITQPFGLIPDWADDFFRQLGEYFEGCRRVFEVPVRNTQGTVFQRKIWEICSEIPYGEVRTYGDMARLAGSDRAFRAAGQALGRNPLPILVPCHRVVARDGSLGGYTGGIEIKKFLLGIEGVSPAVLKDKLKLR